VFWMHDARGRTQFRAPCKSRQLPRRIADPSSLGRQ
jgi:hypothetical protein